MRAFAVVLVVLLGAGEKPEDAKLSEQEKALLSLVNEARKKEKLPPVKVNALLCRAARLHSENMARQEKMEHRLDGKGVGDRVSAAGYDWRVVRENLALAEPDGDPKAPPPPPAEIQEKWMQSKGHRANILTPKVTEAGISMALSKKGTYFYTLVLAAPRD